MKLNNNYIPVIIARIDYLARMTGFYSPIPEQDRSINITCKTSNTSLLTQR